MTQIHGDWCLYIIIGLYAAKESREFQAITVVVFNRSSTAANMMRFLDSDGATFYMVIYKTYTMFDVAVNTVSDCGIQFGRGNLTSQGVESKE